MKRIILIGYIFLSAATCFSGDIIKIDVKTPFAQKNELYAIKAGTLYFINKTDKFRIQEVGEDFSLWIKDYNAKQKLGIVFISVIIELRSPSMIRSGRLFEKEEINISFPVEDKLSDEDEKLFEQFKANMSKIKSDLLREAYFSGKKITKITKKMVKRHLKDI